MSWVFWSWPLPVQSTGGNVAVNNANRRTRHNSVRYAPYVTSSSVNAQFGLDYNSSNQSNYNGFTHNYYGYPTDQQPSTYPAYDYSSANTLGGQGYALDNFYPNPQSADRNQVLYHGYGYQGNISQYFNYNDYYNNYNNYYNSQWYSVDARPQSSNYRSGSVPAANVTLPNSRSESESVQQMQATNPPPSSAQEGHNTYSRAQESIAQDVDNAENAEEVQINPRQEESRFWTEESSGIVRCSKCGDDYAVLSRRGVRGLYSNGCGHFFCGRCLRRPYLSHCTVCHMKIKHVWKIYVT